MSFNFLTSTRRNFLRACGLLATGSAATTVVLGDSRTRSVYGSNDPDWLREWNALPRRPIREARDPVVGACLEAAATGKPLSLYYHGGTTPGRLRRFSPELVFQLPVSEHRYVSGYCHLRQAPRILRADRISLA